MRYRGFILSMLLWLVCVGVSAADLQRLSERSIMGTARYVGLAGAMTAVGGDPTAVADNPAGLGVYRRMEVSASLDIPIDCTGQMERDNDIKSTGAMISNFSWVMCIPSAYGSRVVSNNLMLSFRRSHVQNRAFVATHTGEEWSLMDVSARMSYGLSPAYFLDKDGNGRPLADVFNDTEMGWLTVLGYENYLIDPVGDQDNTWVSPLHFGDLVSNRMELSESGSVNEFCFDWAMNYAHRLYIGAALNVQSLSRRRSVTYSEWPDSKRWLVNQSSVTLSGIGVNAAFGLLYHPVRALRLGASITTPSYVNLSVSNYGSMSAKMRNASDPNTFCETPVSSSRTREFLQPMRFSAGVALQLYNYGLLSLQYDLAHSKNIYDIHRFSVGIEGVAINRFFLEAGYSYETSFIGDAQVNDLVDNHRLAYNTARTDTDFEYIPMRQYVSGGFGYRGKWGTAHLAYQYAWNTMPVYAHELATPYDMKTKMHRIVLTLNWHTRD